MNLDDLEPLPEDMQNLLRQGRPGREPPAAAREAALSFIAAHGIAAAAAVAAHGASVGTAGTAGTTTALKAWGSLKASFGVGGILLGVAVGAGGHAAYVANHAAHVPVASASASAVAVSASRTAEENHEWIPVTEPSSIVPSPSAPVARSAAVPAAAASAGGRTEDAGGNAGRDNLLGAERNLIDTARTAVARGDGDAALATLARHTREFPHGRLAEEREWLTIQALVLSSRGEEARTRATAFRQSFPHSLMLPALDEVLPP